MNKNIRLKSTKKYSSLFSRSI